MLACSVGELLFLRFQCALLGKLPVSLVTPITLHSILSDIALNLPENYECPFEDSRAVFFTVQNYRLPYAVVSRLLFKVSVRVPLLWTGGGSA